MIDFSRLSALGLDFPFRLVAESESSCSPDADPTATRTHADNEPCNCPWECDEVCDELWDEHNAHRFPH